MPGLPEWLKESIKQRFSELTYTAQMQDKVLPVKTKASLLLEQFCKHQDEHEREAFRVWTELKNQQYTLEKEWLYHEGLKDGLRLFREIYRLAED